jgi:hypothetical protein
MTTMMTTTTIKAMTKMPLSLRCNNSDADDNEDGDDNEDKKDNENYDDAYDGWMTMTAKMTI